VGQRLISFHRHSCISRCTDDTAAALHTLELGKGAFIPPSSILHTSAMEAVKASTSHGDQSGFEAPNGKDIARERRRVGAAGPPSSTSIIGTEGRFNLLELPAEIRLEVCCRCFLQFICSSVIWKCSKSRKSGFAGLVLLNTKSLSDDVMYYPVDRAGAQPMSVMKQD
jgi:hypothetical protein